MGAITSGEFWYLAALAILGAFFSFAAAASRRDRPRLMWFFLGSFSLRIALLLLNGWFNIVAEMPASVIAWRLDQEGGPWEIFRSTMLEKGNLTNLKFFLEALINAPALRLFENAPIMLNFTNCFVGATSAIIAFAYSVRLFGRRIAAMTLLITSFFPAALSFSLFGLRDIIIYFFLLFEIFSFSWLVLRKDHRTVNLLGCAGSFLCVVSMRPALLPFLLILPGSFVLTATFRSLQAVKERSHRIMLGSMAALGLLAAGTVTLVASYAVVLHSVKIDTLGTPDVLLRQYAEQRAWRGYDPVAYQQAWRGSHGAAQYSPAHGNIAASEYLSAQTYLHLSWLGRALVQIVGFIVLPLPWQLDSPARVLALFDSVFVITCLAWAWQAHRALQRSAEIVMPLPAAAALRTLSLALLLSFVLSWLGYAMLVSDAGNAFRMRLSVVPFVLLGASIHGAAVWPARLTALARQSREFLYSRRLPDRVRVSRGRRLSGR